MSPRSETDTNSDDQNEEIEILHADKTLIINGLLCFVSYYLRSGSAAPENTHWR